MTLSPQRARVLAFVRLEVRAGRPFPSYVDIARHMGWRSTTGVYDALHHLAWLGYLHRSRDPEHHLVFELKEQTTES